MSSNLVAPPQSVSQILVNARSHKERLCNLLTNIKNIRIQLDGDFPTTQKGEDKEVAKPGLVGRVIDVQSDQDDIIDAIFTHLDVIHEKLGSSYHPECEDQAESHNMTLAG